MPFVKFNPSEEIERQIEENPKFKKAWEENHTEYELIGELIALRKQKKLTQKELAALTGNKQQVISRIERKEMIPSIKIFSNILNALGYELRIAKKENMVQ